MLRGEGGRGEACSCGKEKLIEFAHIEVGQGSLYCPTRGWEVAWTGELVGTKHGNGEMESWSFQPNIRSYKVTQASYRTGWILMEIRH